MRCLVLALGLILAALPARAVELVISYPNQAALIQLATALGLYDPVAKQLTTQGAIVSGGSYFANVVGTVYQPTGATTTDQFGNTVAVMAALPDKYLRLRHNGEQAVLDSKMGPAILTQAAALGVKIYRLLRTSQTDAGCWSSDGATCGPDYIATVGLIQ